MQEREKSPVLTHHPRTCTRVDANKTSASQTPSSTSLPPQKPREAATPPPATAATISMAPDVASMSTTPTTPATLKTSQKPATGPNVLEVVFGSLLVKPWYPSFYPEELVGRRVDRLYVCQWCFKYSKEIDGFLGHIVSVFCLGMFGYGI